jgi:GcrA cell cycle regulator
MSWNDERVELLKKLWAEGLSASQIAGQIGGVTRNAVIGKVHRLGLSGRATTTRSSSRRPRARITTTRRAVRPRFTNPGNSALRALYHPDAEPYVSTFEELDIPLAERKSLQDLTESSCRWPIGDPQNADFHFCNRHKVAGLPYCELHSRRAFQPPQARRRGGTDTTPATVPVLTSPSPAEDKPVEAEQPAQSREPVDA